MSAHGHMCVCAYIYISVCVCIYVCVIVCVLKESSVSPGPDCAVKQFDYGSVVYEIAPGYQQTSDNTKCRSTTDPIRGSKMPCLSFT